MALSFRPTLQIVLFYVKNIFPAEPLLVAVVIHQIAEPRRSEDLCFFPSSRSLRFQRFLNTRLDDVRVLQEQIPVVLIFICKPVAVLLLGARRPDDVLLC